MAYGTLIILSTFKKKRTLFSKERSKNHFLLSLASKAVFVPHSFASLTLFFLIKYVIIYRVRFNSASSFSGNTGILCCTGKSSNRSLSSHCVNDKNLRKNREENFI